MKLLAYSKVLRCESVAKRRELDELRLFTRDEMITFTVVLAILSFQLFTYPTDARSRGYM